MDPEKTKVKYCRGSTDYFERIIGSGQEFFGRSVLQIILYLLSCIYRVLVFMRRLLYTLGIFRIQRLPVPVVSIGNLTTGGTGKTPFTIECARYFRDQGKRVVIVSRGYRRRTNTPVQIISDGKQILFDVKNAGDEPYLMAMKCADVPVIVGKQRFAAAMEGIRNYSPHVVLLDDGFQHLALYRDIDVVLLDAEKPFSNNHLLPRGHLRESPRQIKRADFVYLVKKSPIQGNSKPQIHHPHHVNGVILYHPVALADKNLEYFAELEYLKYKKIICFCGIGNPEPLLKWLIEFDTVVLIFFIFDDHHEYTRSDMNMLKKAKTDSDADLLLTTEKDIIKLDGLETDMEILALQMECALPDAKTCDGIFQMINQRLVNGRP